MGGYPETASAARAGLTHSASKGPYSGLGPGRPLDSEEDQIPASDSLLRLARHCPGTRASNAIEVGTVASRLPSSLKTGTQSPSTS
jgi:hypothetical protein